MALTTVTVRLLSLATATFLSAGALLTPGTAAPVLAHHDIPFNHKSADYALEIGAKTVNNAAPQPGSRIAFHFLMSNEGSTPDNLWDNGTDRPRLSVGLHQAFTNISVLPNGADVCEIKTVAEAGKLPGTRIECEGIRGTFGKEQPGLLWPHAPRSIVVEATNPRTEGQYRVTASISPIKYWDSVPGNNHASVAIAVANVVKKSEALKGPRYGN